MKSVKQKREQLMKQIRSKQRNDKISQNRQKLFASYEEESLVSMIFLMIDKDSQQITAESFDDFLEIISDEMLEASEEQNKINSAITDAIIQRYGQLLRQFQQRFISCDPIERVSFVDESRKVFDLIRFLTRLQFIEKVHINILDLLLESADINLKQLIDRSIQIQCNNYKENNPIQTMDGFIMILQLRLKLLKQLHYLYFLSTTTKYQGTKKSKVREEQKELIFLLTEKWIINYLLLNFLYLPSFLHFIRKSQQHWQRLQKLIQNYEEIYLEFLVQHNEVLQKIINKQDTIKSHKKITQVLFMLFSLSKKNQNEQVEITRNQNNQLDKQLILFMDVGMRIIKSVQGKVNDSEQRSSCMRKRDQQFLKCLIDSFVSDPFEVLKTFLQTMQSTQRDQFLQSTIYLIKGRQKQPYPLIVRLVYCIQELQYCDLVNFIQLLSIIISYNETAIDLLFNAPTFQGYYHQKLNFYLLLETKLLTHLSGEVRRRAAWLLSNITASELFYSYGLHFLKNLYLSNFLENHCSHTKEDALINQSLLQAIMNYLSNLKTFKEVEELISFNMKNYKENTQFSSYENQKLLNIGNSSNNQSLFIWIIRTLGSVVQNLSTNNVILKNTQRFIEVLIYSLYNILILQENERQEQNPHAVLSIMQTYGIPKNIERIYHNAETSNQYSRFFSMIETLLDLIDKIKNEN